LKQLVQRFSDFLPLFLQLEHRVCVFSGINSLCNFYNKSEIHELLQHLEIRISFHTPNIRIFIEFVFDLNWRNSHLSRNTSFTFGNMWRLVSRAKETFMSFQFEVQSMLCSRISSNPRAILNFKSQLFQSSQTEPEDSYVYIEKMLICSGNCATKVTHFTFSDHYIKF